MKLAFSIATALLLTLCCIAPYQASAHISNHDKVKTLLDSVSATWQLDKVDMDTTQGAQIRDLTTFMQGLVGNKITMKNDGTYSFAIADRVDTGTWKLTATRAIEAVSTAMKSSAELQIVSLDNKNLVVRYINNSMPLVLTFVKTR